MKYHLNACAAAVIAALSASASYAQEQAFEITSTHEYSYASGATFCVTGSDALEDSPQLTDLKAFVEVFDKNTQENLDVIPYVKQNELCLGGLQNGHSYDVKVKKGLLSSHKHKLMQDHSFNIKVQDAAPRVSMEKGVLLPSEQSNAELYIKSLNVQSLKVALYKVNRDDTLSTEFARYLYGDLKSWDRSPLLSDHAELCSEKTYATQGDPNKESFTAVDLKELYQKNLEDGVYVLSVKDASLKDEDEFDEDCQDRFFTRLIIVSNLAVTSYRGQNSMRVAVRSLKSANPVAGAEVKVLARSGRSLYNARTDADGFVNVPGDVLHGTDALRATAITALLGSDFFMLPLEEQAQISLDEISGKEQNLLQNSVRSDLKVTGYFDRGIARPGENLHYTALVRNRDLSASDLQALSLKLRRPDGTVISQFTATAKGAGFFEADFAIPKRGPRGQWSVDACLGQDLLTSQTIQIADFKPSDITVAQKALSKELKAGTEALFEVEASYNYGSPAASLQTDGNVTYTPQDKPFLDATLSQYHFGPNEDEVQSENLFVALPLTLLDLKGKGRFELQIPQKPFALKATVNSTVYSQDSQAVSQKDYVLMPNNSLIGLKLNDLKTQIEALTLDAKAHNTHADLSYTIKRRLHDYQFVFTNGSWRYVPQTRSYNVQSAVIKGDTNAQNLNIDLSALDDGQYELEARTKDGGYSSLIFTKGYSYSDAKDRPDRLEITCDKAFYQRGDQVKLSFISAKEGSADLIVGSDETLFSKRFNLKKGQNELTFKIDDSIGSGAHVLISTISEASSSPTPIRAFGLTYINVDAKEHHLPLKAELPQSVKPGETLNIKLDSDSKSTKLRYTAALVDEGILNLTSFKTPDPFKIFTTPGNYNLKINDLCGFLLRAFAKDDQGYGADYMMLGAARSPEALQLLNEKIIAMHHGVTAMNDGHAEIAFKVPEHQGALRLMITAADEQALGSLERTIKVRDDIVPSVAISQLLHVGDESKASFLLRDSLLKDDSVKVDLTCTGAIKCANIKDSSLQLQDARASFGFKVQAINEGVGSINYTIKAHDFNKEGSYALQVMPSSISVLMQKAAFVKKGQSATLKLPAKSVDQAVLTTGSSPLNAKLLQKNLLQYEPYDATTEALVLTALLDIKADAQHIAPIFDSLLSRFDSSGFIDYVDEYTTVLACSALLQAKSHGYYVPDDLGQILLRRIKSTASYGEPCTQALAYEALAELKALNLSSLRYAYEQLQDRTLSPLTCASFSRAFKLSGDDANAKNALSRSALGFKNLYALDETINKAQEGSTLNDALNERRNFESASLSSALYDQAVCLKTALQNGDEHSVENVVENVFDIELLLSNYDLAINAVLCQVTGNKNTQISNSHLNGASLDVRNESTHDQWYVLQGYGIADDSFENAQDLKMSYSFINPDGSVLKDETLKIRDHKLLLLEIKRQNAWNKDVVIRTALPSGFALEKVLNEDSASKIGIKNAITPRNIESGDEGIVLTLDGNALATKHDFKVALAVRADAKGNFVIPSTQIFDPAVPGTHVFNNTKKINVQ